VQEIRGGEVSQFVIDDSTDVGELNAGRTTGAVPRDYTVTPPQTFRALPSAIPLIPRHEWRARIQEQDERQSSLKHLHQRAGWPLLDQNGHGYCWAYSVGHAIMFRRMLDNQPYVRINPHATAAIIKQGRDEGGWCGLSAQFAIEHGYAVEGNGPGQWPLHSRNLRSDTPELRASMAKHKVSESFIDLQLPAYDRNMVEDQIVSCLLQNIPVPADFGWWGHSVMLGRAGWSNDGIVYDLFNSWAGWGDRGWGTIAGGRKQTMGALGVCVVGASTN
jgi:hypothetical protein